MPVWLRTIIGIFVVVIIGCGGLFLYQMSQSRSNDYNTIAQHWTKGGKFIDYAQDLGVVSADDLHYWVDKEEQKVEISYGFVQLEYTWEELEDEEIEKQLRFIGLTYEVNKKHDNYRFYWQGVELEPWSESNIVG